MLSNSRRGLVASLLSAVAVLLVVDIAVRLATPSQAQPIQLGRPVAVMSQYGAVYRLWSDGHIDVYDDGVPYGSGIQRWEGWRQLPN